MQNDFRLVNVYFDSLKNVSDAIFVQYLLDVFMNAQLGQATGHMQDPEIDLNSPFM